MLCAKGKEVKRGRRQEVSGGRLKLWIRRQGRPPQKEISACVCAARGRTFQEANTLRQELECSEPGEGREEGGEHAGL